MASICMLVLCGLPASGKSSWVQQFIKWKKSLASTRLAGCSEETILNWHIVSIPYDSLMPADVEAKLIISDDCEKASQWKDYRKSIINCIEFLIKRLLYEGKVKFDGSIPEFLPKELQQLFKNLIENQLEIGCYLEEKTHQTYILIVDDNMYYASMRYQIHQLARKYSISFAQIYFQIEVSLALERNRQRDDRVDDSVIVSMNAKMEAPSMSNAWERLTIHWTTGSDNTNFEKVIDLLSNALRNPLVTKKDDQLMAEESRAVCSKNMIHQADKILRKCVAAEIEKAKSKRDTIADVAKWSNVVRTEILEELRNRKLLLPYNSTEDGEKSSSNEDSSFYEFISEIFSHRVNS